MDSGFTDHLFVLQQITEQGKACQKSIVLNVIDFKRIFDNVQRTSMWEVVVFHEIPNKLVNIMKITYDGLESYMKVSLGHPDFLNVDSGIRQGDSLYTSF